jgi:hypothetical protein
LASALVEPNDPTARETRKKVVVLGGRIGGQFVPSAN